MLTVISLIHVVAWIVSKHCGYRVRSIFWISCTYRFLFIKLIFVNFSVLATWDRPSWILVIAVLEYTFIVVSYIISKGLIWNLTHPTITKYPTPFYLSQTDKRSCWHRILSAELYRNGFSPHAYIAHRPTNLIIMYYTGYKFYYVI